MTRVSNHAVGRYVERVEPIAADTVPEAILSETVRLAIQFANGAEVFVRRATGQRIVCRGDTVVTVLPAENYKRGVRRVKRGRYE